MKKFFSKTATLLAIFVAIIIGVGIRFLYPELGYNFAHDFSHGGISQILAPITAIFVWFGIKSLPPITSKVPNEIIAVGVATVLFFTFFFGPAISRKLNREESIPDTQVYYGNGKVINATDSTKKNYYFKQFSLTPEDSVYVVTYGEEPGYNFTNSAVRDSLYSESTAPRANEDWIRPRTKEAQKFDNGKRQQ